MRYLKSLTFPIRPKFFCLLFAVGVFFPVGAQILVQGTIIDSLNSLPVPDVNIRTTSRASTISDGDGNFSLVVTLDDTLHFSHISYHDLAIGVGYGPQPTKFRVVLRQKIRLLAEVKIYSYLSERVFKQKILETTPALSREEEIARINSSIISQMARYAPTTPMDANDNYIDYMKGPQGVVILSSNPSKGLIRAIKNIISPPRASYKKFYHADSLQKTPRLR